MCLNIGLIFQKFCHLTILKHSVLIFSLILDLVILFDVFDPSFFQNFRSDWVHFFMMLWILYQYVGEVLLPPP